MTRTCDLRFTVPPCRISIAYLPHVADLLHSYFRDCLQVVESLTASPRCHLAYTRAAKCRRLPLSWREIRVRIRRAYAVFAPPFATSRNRLEAESPRGRTPVASYSLGRCSQAPGSQSRIARLIKLTLIPLQRRNCVGAHSQIDVCYFEQSALDSQQLGDIALKLTADRPYLNPEVAAKRLLEITKDVSSVQDGRIYIELINGPFLFRDRGSAAEYGVGLKLLIERKQITLHESGTYLRILKQSPLVEVPLPST